MGFVMTFITKGNGSIRSPFLLLIRDKKPPLWESGGLDLWK